MSACLEQADTPKKLTERKKYENIENTKKIKNNKTFKKIGSPTCQINLIFATMILIQFAHIPHGWKMRQTQTIENWNKNTHNQSKYCFQLSRPSSQPEWSYEWKMIKKQMNKLQHSLNGNNNTVSIYHWNLGSRSWSRKLEDIQAAVDDLNPDYMFISESNLWEQEADYCTQIMGYDIIKPKTCNTANNKISRIILLAKKGLQYQTIPQLMDEEITSIWFKTGNGRSKLVVGGGV